MMKLSVLIMLVSGLLMADSGVWKSFQSDEKFFTASFPCSSKNILVNKDDKQTERMYKCEFNGSTYSLSQFVFTDAGKKSLQSRPSNLVEESSRELQKKYVAEKGTVEVNKIYRQHPYRRLEVVATSNKMKYYTSVFDGPETRVIFSGSGPATEDANLKKASDSLKPN